MRLCNRNPAALLLSAFLTLQAAQAFAASPVEEPARVKAVQVLVIDDPDMESTRLWLRRYRKAGFNTVIIRTFHLRGDRPHLPAGPVTPDTEGVYFQTDRAPVIKDILSPFTDICRQEGLRVYAWMVTRNARFGNEALPGDVSYDPAEGTLGRNPDLDIMDPAVEAYLKALFKDLAATGVDGILLQDDLASRMTQGFTVGNLNRYRRETGETSLPYRHLKTVHAEDGRTYLRAGSGFEPWVRWKSGRITSLARELENVVRTVNPRVRVAINLTYEALTDPDNGRLWLSHDLPLALKDGPTYAAVMLYHQQIQEELGMELPEVLALLERSLKDLEGTIEHRTRIILKFQTRDWTTGRPVQPDELMSALLTSWGRGWSIALVPPLVPRRGEQP